MITKLAGFWVAFVLMALGGHVFAQSEWPPCPVNGLKDKCFGEGASTGGQTYVGAWTNGQPSGTGSLEFVGGSKYVGQILNGEINGQGTFTYPNGRTLVGEFKDGQFLGEPGQVVGAIKDASASSMLPAVASTDGPIRSDINVVCPSQVTPQVPTKAADEGIWGVVRARFRIKDGVVQDVTMTGPRVFYAAVRDAVMQYKCVFSPVETVATQEFSFTPPGLLQPHYEGGLKDGKYHGQGRFTWSNGDVYIGAYKDGKKEGRGVYYQENGTVLFDGIWENDRFVEASGKSRYEGGLKDGKYHGQGKFLWANGEVYVGEYKDGKKDGRGIHYLANGTVLSNGIWENDRFVGSEREAPLALTTTPATNQEAVKVLAANDAKKQRQAERQAEENRRAQALVSTERQRSSENVTNPQVEAAPAPVAPAVIAHALIIGNGAYAGSGRLDNPVNDARAMSRKLRDLGFTVTEVNDANRAKLINAFAQFSRTAANAEITLLFYSGHGVQIYGTNYVLPIDVDQNDIAQATLQGVSLNSVIEQFMPGKTKLVFLDACRDNPLVRTASRGMTKGLAPISVAQGTLIAYSTKDGQVAMDGVGQKNSPFTTALLDHLADPIDIAVVLRKVRAQVMQATSGKQEPWEYGSLTGGELILGSVAKR